MNDEKFCVNCKHKTIGADQCMHPSLWGRELNLVTGTMDMLQLGPVLCKNQRDYGECGHFGKLFEPAPDYTEQDIALNRTVLLLIGVMAFIGMVAQVVKWYWS